MEMESEIQRLIGQINRAWVENRVDELVQYFHEGMVIVAPQFGGRLEGREACIESYREFTGRATVEEVQEKDLSIDVRGCTAVATYRYAVSYTLNGARHRDSGWDVFVFTREGERWLAVWRTMILPGGGE